jgi:hypothetical protein
MKKSIGLLTVVFGLLPCLAPAQDSNLSLGMKIAPVLNSSRVKLDDELVGVFHDKATMKVSFGLVVDKSFGENYAFSTGLIYVPKQVSITVSPDATVADNPAFASPQAYKLQYLQIPLTLKLSTNEVKPDMRVQFQLGVAPEIRVYQEPLEGSGLITTFQPFDFPVIIGAGVEYRLGTAMKAFGGLSYQRGLVNVVKTSVVANLEIRNTVLSLEFGIKF